MKLASAAAVLAIPAVLAAGMLFGRQYYAVTGTLTVMLSMLPFFFSFEHRRPRAREIVPIAVMAALAVAGRAAFAALPQFKPTLAIVILTALVFGPEAGFMTGTVSMLVSNFLFGQGPWTPWQMFCCGLIGLIAGLLRAGGLLRRVWSVCVYGFLSGYLYGSVVDLWTASSFAGGLSLHSLLAVYAAGFWFSTVLAAATAFFLLVLDRPLERRLLRVRRKYGLSEPGVKELPGPGSSADG